MFLEFCPAWALALRKLILLYLAIGQSSSLIHIEE
jgi:hypothetical protein